MVRTVPGIVRVQYSTYSYTLLISHKGIEKKKHFDKNCHSKVNVKNRTMADPGADFKGYMEDMAKVEAEREATRELLQRHEEWRQTTWAGFCVRQMQAIAKNIEPTMAQIAQTFGNSDSMSSVIIFNFLRFFVVMVAMVGIYGMAQLIQKFIGNEIIVEEEIVTVHEYDTEEEAAKARRKESRSKTDKGNKCD